jgi:hypothetical protein
MEVDVVRIPRQSASLPPSCPCCLGNPDSELVLQNTKAYPLLVVTVHQTTSVAVPYCSNCVRHVLWFQDGGLSGTLLRAGVVFLLTAGLLAIPGAFIWLGAWIRAGDTGTRLVFPTYGLIALAIAVILGLVAAAISLRRRLCLRPTEAIDARHAHPTKALSLAAATPTDYYFAVRNVAYSRELLAQVPGAEPAAPVALAESRQLRVLQWLLLLVGLVGTGLAIAEAWRKTGP